MPSSLTIGLTGSMQMLRWYRIAADANNTEGLFLLGWAHHRGVGVDRNLAAAKEVYLRAVKQAGKSQRARSVAPLVGLLALRIDAWLRPAFGDDVTQSMGDSLKRVLGIVQAGRRRMKAGGGTDGGAPGVGGGVRTQQEKTTEPLADEKRGEEGPVTLSSESGQDEKGRLSDWTTRAWNGIWKALEVSLGSWTGRLEASSAAVENGVMAVLVVCLVIVLRLRQQRRPAAGV